MERVTVTKKMVLLLGMMNCDRIPLNSCVCVCVSSDNTSLVNTLRLLQKNVTSLAHMCVSHCLVSS